MSGNPKITLSFTELFCAEHGEPFRAEWPKGAALAQLGIFNVALKNKRILEACGINNEGKADSRQLNRVLREFGPLCCFLPSQVVQEVIMLALAGVVWGVES